MYLDLCYLQVNNIKKIASHGFIISKRMGLNRLRSVLNSDNYLLIYGEYENAFIQIQNSL